MDIKHDSKAYRVEYWGDWAAMRSPSGKAEYLYSLDEKIKELHPDGTLVPSIRNIGWYETLDGAFKGMELHRINCK